MREFMNFLSAHNAYFILGLAAVCIILFFYTGSLSRRIKRMNKRRDARLEEGRVEDLLDYLTEVSNSLSALSSRLEGFSNQQSELNAALASCVQNTGMVRFNAFEDVGGEQSFALALLDSNKDGVVVSSLYGRQDSRLYAKGIIKGEGERPLSTEERMAVEKALS